MTTVEGVRPQQDYRSVARDIAVEVVALAADDVDREARFPR